MHNARNNNNFYLILRNILTGYTNRFFLEKCLYYYHICTYFVLIDTVLLGKSRKLMDPPRGACLLGDKITPSGQQTHPDRCTQCTCTNSTAVCTRETCSPLDCPVEEQTFSSHNQCCPQCLRTLNKSETCEDNGKIYMVNFYINHPSLISQNHVLQRSGHRIARMKHLKTYKSMS